MSVLSELSDKALAKKNNEKPIVVLVGVVIDGIGITKEPSLSLKLVVKDGHGKEVARFLSPHIQNLLSIVEKYNESKKGEGDGTYKTTLVTFDLGI